METFAANGFEQTSLRAIAATAGVDVALISYRYGSKMGLWQAIVTEVARETVELLEAAIARAQDRPQAERVDFISSEVVDVIWRRTHFSRIMFSEIIQSRDEERKDFIEEALAKPFLEVVYPFVQSSLEAAGQKRPFDIKLGMMASIALAGLLSSTREFTGRFVEVARQDEMLQYQVKQIIKSMWTGPANNAVPTLQAAGTKGS
ncbi:MAG: TetR family transcriptional regulator [Alphaproteobacteria bacterium]|nr:TetR family transcriptional regulator [Alphaproteobacteria bacterium]MBU0832379.1 TetR family transcriptional regulator [Alphaproteobacteria bacterium]MBU1764860.1 TetR family transcriptional regulator [Alphaproteobacteria bacterium]